MSEDVREASREQWSHAADGWATDAAKRETGPFAAAADWMLAAAALPEGGRVLEVACGAGDLGIRAASIVGPSGRVLCTDFAEPMVDAVRTRAESLGLDQVEAAVHDAEDPAPGGERFDAVLCRFGYMLMPDPAKALRASLDSLDDGGRLALAVWGPGEGNPWLSARFDAFMAVLDAPPPAPGAPGPFALGDAGRVRSLLDEAGFAGVEVDTIVVDREYASPEAWWSSALEGAGLISSMLEKLPDEQVTEIRRRAVDTVAELAGDDGRVTLPATIVVASARRSG